jgi:hypothetical protein
MSEEVELKIDTPNERNISEISRSSSEIEKKNTWKSCCLRVDRRAVQFFSQLVISLMIITFCLFQLHYLPKCESGEYLSLLTMVLGTWIEAPRLHN